MNIVPVRFRDRWIDDGTKIELWNQDRSLGLRLDVASTSKTEPLAAMEIRRIGQLGQVPVTGLASLIVDLANGEIRFHASPGGVLDPPLDLDWLRGKLDDEMRAALRQRVERRPRVADLYDWKDGDRLRVRLGERAAFAQMFPAAWDLVVTHRGRRYGLVDTHRVSQDAEDGPVGLEIVDLDTVELVGTAEIHLDRDRRMARGTAPMWRCTGPIADPLLAELRQDPDRWYELVGRAETIGRAARVMGTWERDVRDPGAAVKALLAELGDPEEVLLDRVKALGSRCVPALRRTLDDPDDETSRFAARMLAELGDASGLDRLVAALADPGFEVIEGESFAMADAIAVLGEAALDPLLAALANARDRTAQDRLLDALTLIDVHDDRVRDLLVGIVRAEPGRAGLLGDYGDGSPTVVAVLVELLGTRLNALRDDLDDDDAFGDASEIVQALRDLEVQNVDLLRYEQILDMRREALRVAMRERRTSADAAVLKPQPRFTRPAPVHATPRPGRNEPCWCGSTKKYKKCHLEADDQAREAVSR